MDVFFFLNSILFGGALAMDAFSVSIADGLRYPDMPAGKRCAIAGTFGAFQTAMPLIGWFCVHAAAEHFSRFRPVIPWIALILLLYLGIHMLREAKAPREEAAQSAGIGAKDLLLQGLATSIDALSVGFTIAELGFAAALTEALIIGAVTFGLCVLALFLGGRLGVRVQHRAPLIGGVILILIGLEIWVKGVFFS